MINIDSSSLLYVTPSGYGLRETLFYNLFSRLQVYKTRAEMMQALPYISDGALSLDGGMIRSCGVFSLGRADVEVRFPRPDRSTVSGLDGEFGTEGQLKVARCKKEKILEDLKREQTLLDMAKLNLMQSSASATQHYQAQYTRGWSQAQTARGRGRFKPRS